MKTEKLFSEIESLPLDLKVKLVEKILLSINPIEKDIDKLWAEEAEKRLKEIETKKEKLISEEDIFKEIYKK
ncbi:conserved hypothetical protein [Deferribacter desulfuricans SSM1]|uniref:Addiction module protein n=1 Tax=Deferribacter desulfuricans (strain DSM 14783 / JCM 11476 / NBRC 101012 / SSM1) TaxID=639282 RepID=D3PBA6_DEFDS|nr:addiction module protein [Deferribacter desulfuricans]BAI79879.1 conserved hypothetical protein [Deferribacter desulfuricans SSM1]